MDLQIISAVIFVVLLIVFIIVKRKNIVLQKILFPFLYLILYRSNFGLKFIDKFTKKYKEQIKFFGYTCIGLGFIGMIFISINIILMVYTLIITPEPVAGVALVLPFTNVPGIGYLSFFHWIIAIFILAVVHEFAHGIVAKANGIEIKSSGFAFFALIAPIIPAAFVEPDEKKLRKESDVAKYSVFAAGPMVNILLALIILFAMPYVGNITKLAPFEGKITDPIGFSYDLLDGDYPASAIGMEPGIMKGINGEQITDFDSFIDATYGIRPGEEVSLTTDKGEYILTTVVSPDNPKKGFIGIKPVANERRMKSGFEWLKHPFYWIKDLFKWLFLLNFFIGLFNLLPLGIVDGGRMLDTLLQRTMKNKKKARKIWGIISALFLIAILFGLITSYLGNPFAFLLK